MSINPAQAIGSTADLPSAIPEDRLHSNPNSRVSPSPAPTTSGTEPTREVLDKHKASASAEVPQDEVQVQRDNASNGQIVIRYMDRSGQVILQVPSSQVLGLARAIERALQDQAQKRTTAGSASFYEGETQHGD